jgi:hypothetical protein
MRERAADLLLDGTVQRADHRATLERLDREIAEAGAVGAGRGTQTRPSARRPRVPIPKP